MSTTPGEVTVREAAARVGRTEETVRRWIWSGRLAAHKRGNVLFVRASDLDSLAAAGSTRPRRPSARPTLAEWVAELDRTLGTQDRAGGSAADLVLADRDARAGR